MFDRKSRVRPWCALLAGALFITLFLPSLAGAASLHVATWGSNSGDGSTGAPWATIRYALTRLQAGDTLTLHGGPFTGAENIIDSQAGFVPSGVDWAPIVIQGESRSVTIQPPANTTAIKLTYAPYQYLVFRNFTIDMSNSTPGSDAAAIFLYVAHHITFDGLDIKNGTNDGVHFEASAYNVMTGCAIHGFGYPTGDTPHLGHGLYITASYNLFENNDVYDNWGFGFHVYNNHGSHDDPSYNVIRRNRIHHNGQYGTATYGVTIAWGTGNLVYDNLVYQNAEGIQVYSASTSTGVYNNTVWGNPGEGISLQYYYSPPDVRNNIVVNNGLPIADWGGYGGSASFSNNLCDFGSYGCTLSGNPGFASPSGGNFQIAAGGAASNAGLNLSSIFTFDFTGASRPSSGAWDLGALQSSSSGGGSSSSGSTVVSPPVAPPTAPPPTASGSCSSTSLLPQSQMRIVTASVDLMNAKSVLDGQSWSKWQAYPLDSPQSLVIGLGGQYRVCGVNYAPESWTSVDHYAVYVSDDPSNWGSAVAQGSISASGGNISFGGATGSYVKFVAIDGAGGQSFAYVSDLDIVAGQ
jgi:parallel beta-helix repeat protein